MKTYSYAFGDHTLFLRKSRVSFPSLERAIIYSSGTAGGLLHIYEDALFACGMDAFVGGELVMVIDWSALLTRLDAAWFNKPSVLTLDLLERYVRRLVCCRLKEQK